MKFFVSIVGACAITYFILKGGAFTIVTSPVGTQIAPFAANYLPGDHQVSKSLKIKVPKNWLILESENKGNLHFLHLGPSPMPIVELELVPTNFLAYNNVNFQFNSHSGAQKIFSSLSHIKKTDGLKESFADPFNFLSNDHEIFPFWDGKAQSTSFYKSSALPWHFIEFSQPPRTADGRQLKILYTKIKSHILTLTYLVPIDQFPAERKHIKELTDAIESFL